MLSLDCIFEDNNISSDEEFNDSDDIEYVKENDCKRLVTLEINRNKTERENPIYKDVGRVITKLSVNINEELLIHNYYTNNLDYIKKTRNKYFFPCIIYMLLCKKHNISFTDYSLNLIFPDIKIKKVKILKSISNIDFVNKEYNNTEFIDSTKNCINGWMIVLKSYLVNNDKRKKLKNYSEKYNFDILNINNKLFLNDLDFLKDLSTILNYKILKLILYTIKKDKNYFEFDKYVDNLIFIVLYILYLFYIVNLKLDEKNILKIKLNYNKEKYYSFFNEIEFQNIKDNKLLFSIISLLILDNIIYIKKKKKIIEKYYNLIIGLE